MRTGFVVLLLIIAVVLAGCTASSPEIVMPKTRLAMPVSPNVDDCFFRVNDSAHSEDTGSSLLHTVTGYVSNTCNQPMENLVVHGTFYDTDGREFAAADAPVGHLRYHEVAAFSLSADTQHEGSYTYRLLPLIRGPVKLF